MLTLTTILAYTMVIVSTLMCYLLMCFSLKVKHTIPFTAKPVQVMFFIAFLYAAVVGCFMLWAIKQIQH